MQGFFEGCDYMVTKTLEINPYDPEAYKEKLPDYKPIENVTVNPNPTSGRFSILVNLNKRYDVAVSLIDMLGTEYYYNKWSNVDEINQEIDVSDVSSGIYLLRVVTETDAQEVRVAVTR